MDNVGFLRHINYALVDLEYDMAPDAQLTKPLLLVVGPPRSGTTVFTQFLAYGLAAGYITNIAARFWNAPTLGVRLSQQILGDDPAGDMGQAFFRSSRGQTEFGGGIHEFGYFWMSMSWESPKLHQLAQIQAVLDKPLVMKGIYPSLHIDLVRDALGDKVKLIAVERPFNDVLTSILRCARESDEIDFWFRGWELPGHREAMIEDLSLYERIALRAYYWTRYAAQIADFKVYLPNVCSAPNTALRAIAQSLNLPEYREIPDSWLSYHSYDTEYDFLLSKRFIERAEAVCGGMV